VPRELVLHPLADDVLPEALAGASVVVIDVLRASTTIVYALAAGATEILPCLEVEAACKLAATLPPGQVLLGGERLGLPIEGFDLGNSPREYTVARVRGCSIVFTSTNGTRALERCRLAERVFLGAFVNLSAVARAVTTAERLHLVCAGTRGEVSEEDTLLAGALVDRFEAGLLDSVARRARDQWRELEPGPALVTALRHSRGGQNVVANGFDRDIPDAAQIDRFELVPELDPKRFRIR